MPNDSKTDYGESSAGRVYERLEGYIGDRFARLEQTLDNLSTHTMESRERLAVVQEKVSSLEGLDKRIRDLENQKERTSGRDGAISAGFGALSGGIIAYITNLLGR